MTLYNRNGCSLVTVERACEERDVMVDDLVEDLPLLLKILRGRDHMLRNAEEAARARGWTGRETLATFIGRLGHG